jgi:hypothetical protein
MCIYNITQLVNIFRFYGIWMHHFVCLLSYLVVMWISGLFLPFVVIPFLEGEDGWCVESEVYCVGSGFLGSGGVIFLLGILIMTWIQIHTIHTEMGVPEVNATLKEMIWDGILLNRTHYHYHVWRAYRVLHLIITLCECCCGVALMMGLMKFQSEVSEWAYGNLVKMGIWVCGGFVCLYLALSLLLFFSHRFFIYHFSLIFTLSYLSTSMLSFLIYLNNNCVMELITTQHCITQQPLFSIGSLLLIFFLIIHCVLSLLSVAMGAAVNEEEISDDEDDEDGFEINYSYSGVEEKDVPV